MPNYIVDHNGSSRSAKTEELFNYKKGVPVELPEDVAKALGNSATPTDQPTPEQKEMKKAPINKMVGNAQVATK